MYLSCDFVPNVARIYGNTILLRRFCFAPPRGQRLVHFTLQLPFNVPWYVVPDCLRYFFPSRHMLLNFNHLASYRQSPTTVIMSSGKLSSPAEEIRQKIKGMIPDLSDQPIENRATLLETEDSGNKTYGGALLAEQITLLSKHLPISDPEVCALRIVFNANWTNNLLEMGLAFAIFHSTHDS